MQHSGSCHCGAVKYRFDGDLSSAMECNCSMCGRAGTILTFVPEAQFHLDAGENVLQEYRFNKEQIQHLFCKVCGIKPFARGQDPQGNAMIAVNLRCVDGVDAKALQPQFFDGKAL